MIVSSRFKPGDRPVLTLVGSTGSGKTQLALAAARRISAEVISADSRQVYRGFRAGTATPNGEWRSTPEGPRFVVDGVVHHLMDHVAPTEIYTAGRFVREASAVLTRLEERRVPALIVGGTGLYLRSLVRGLAPLPDADPAVRAELSAQALREGRAALHAALARVDPASARAIPAGNLQRVIRALEVHRLTGKPLSLLQREGTRPSPWAFQWWGIRWEPTVYADRLKIRCAAMEEGILEETRAHLRAGVPATAPAFQSLGYREALDCLAGKMSREEFGLALLKQTRAYAKRQATWFRSEPGLRWTEVQAELDLQSFSEKIAGNGSNENQ